MGEKELRDLERKDAIKAVEDMSDSQRRRMDAGLNAVRVRTLELLGTPSGPGMILNPDLLKPG